MSALTENAGVGGGVFLAPNKPRGAQKGQGQTGHPLLSLAGRMEVLARKKMVAVLVCC